MKRFNWQIWLGIILVLLSIGFYLLHYAFFHDHHHILIFLVGDIAFVPIEVLLVTLIIHRMLGAREKRALLKKLNMVIGAFYSEVGRKLLTIISSFDRNAAQLTQQLIPTNDWTKDQFSKLQSKLKHHAYSANSKEGDLKALSAFLTGKRQFLLGLLENPNLLEHDSFTDLLWAVFHLTEELAHRKKVDALPDLDYQHLSGDINRVYGLLVSEWLDYLNHLKIEYPYLYSLAMRTNPFDPDASPELK